MLAMVKKVTYFLKGKNLIECNDEEIRQYRGKEISMIFQDPMSSLNPVHKVGKQIVEMLLLNRTKNKKEAARLALDLLEKVGILIQRTG